MSVVSVNVLNVNFYSLISLRVRQTGIGTLSYTVSYSALLKVAQKKMDEARKKLLDCKEREVVHAKPRKVMDQKQKIRKRKKNGLLHVSVKFTQNKVFHCIIIVANVLFLLCRIHCKIS